MPVPGDNIPALLVGDQSQKSGEAHKDRTPIEFLGDEYSSFSVVHHSAENTELNV